MIYTVKIIVAVYTQELQLHNNYSTKAVASGIMQQPFKSFTHNSRTNITKKKIK